MDHHHDHEDDERIIRGAGGAAEQLDAAGKSLSDAMRVSFTALKIIMIFVLAGWALSGIAFVRPKERGIIRIFGRIVGEVDKGLAYTFPFPIGSIEKVSSQEQKITISSFWVHETPADKAVPLAQRAGRQDGLRPGWDGALLTGDRNLVHMKLSCLYVITAPARYKRDLAEPEQLIEAVVSNAAVLVASSDTADSLIGSGPRARGAGFTESVRRIAQGRLDDLQVGIQISSITREGEVSWPKRAISDYEQLSRASEESQRKVNEARAQARRILSEAAGEKYALLVGSFEEAMGISSGAAAASAEGAGQAEPARLIHKFIEARNSLDAAQKALADARRNGAADEEKVLAAAVEKYERRADKLLEEIGGVLVGGDVQGQAREVVSDASVYYANLVSRLASWRQEFRKIAPKCRTPVETAYQIDSYWADFITRVLQSKTIEKRFVPSGQEKIILITGGVPEVMKEIAEEKVRLTEEQKEKQRTD